MTGKVGNKIYLVAWVVERKNKFSKDHYSVFIEGDSSEENFRDAYKFYKKLIKKRKVSTANICEILESTDY